MYIELDKWKEKIGYQSLLLSLLCGLAALMLSVNQYYTRPVIAIRISEDQNALLKDVIPGELFFNDVFVSYRNVEMNGITYQIYDVTDENGDIKNYVIKGEEDGYSGSIQFLMGVDTVGEIKGVRIISHSETPGLGDKIEFEKSDWVTSFNHRSLTNTIWGVKKDGGEFDQFSGATITPRSVVKGVHNALQALEKDKKKKKKEEVNNG